jgi:hypothetical protein
MLPRMFLTLAAILVLALLVYSLAVRPRMKVWGLTQVEIDRSLPGDELVPIPRWGFKQAITINAPADIIWPWITQMGYQRAGWYSLDWVEKAIGAGDFVDGHSSNRIVPELQDLKTGDLIRIAEPLPYTVDFLEPNRLMVLHSCADTKAGKDVEPTQPLPPDVLNTSWTFYLEPIDGHTTRLTARFVFDAAPTLANTLAFGLFTDGGALLMSPNQLKGIKQRAEAQWKSMGN